MKLIVATGARAARDGDALGEGERFGVRPGVSAVIFEDRRAFIEAVSKVFGLGPDDRDQLLRIGTNAKVAKALIYNAFLMLVPMVPKVPIILVLYARVKIRCGNGKAVPGSHFSFMFSVTVLLRSGTIGTCGTSLCCQRVISSRSAFMVPIIGNAVPSVPAGSVPAWIGRGAVRLGWDGGRGEGARRARSQLRDRRVQGSQPVGLIRRGHHASRRLGAVLQPGRTRPA